MKYEPEVFASENDGMVNFNEPAPDALTLESMVGVVAPAVMPELLPQPPAIVDAESKLTHLMTKGCAHRVGKSWLPTAGGVTLTDLEAVAVPAELVQLRLNVLVLVKAPVDWLPEVALLPDHAPVAKHDVAFVDDQVSVEDEPLATVVGFADSDTVGTGGGGGVPATVTWTEALAAPFAPPQVREKLLLVVSGPVDWLPEVALTPDQAPLAEHDAAFAELHVSVEAPPLATDVGFAASETAGTNGADGVPGAAVWPSAGDSLWVPQAASTTARTSGRCLACKVGLTPRPRQSAVMG